MRWFKQVITIKTITPKTLREKGQVMWCTYCGEDVIFRNPPSVPNGLKGGQCKNPRCSRAKNGNGCWSIKK